MASHKPLKPKLRPPVIGRDTVTRDRLLTRLGYHRPLTLVVAPAGYGKTTLVADWLEHTDYPHAWLSLDVHDDSLYTYVNHLLAAVETLHPDACPETQALLNSASQAPPSVLADTLINELDALPNRFVLVLDDYHSIQDLAIHQLMAELLHYQPHTLEIVLVARHDPPLPLPALRARNRVTEIREQELRFSPDESRIFLQEKNDLLIDDQQVAALDAATEGWPAGLRMVALLLQQQDSGAADLNFDVHGRFALEYLANEILDQLPLDLQTFLLRTAILEQMCGPLCAAVVGADTSVEACQAHLDTLTENHLFVFLLHGEQLWYRYHHLFRRLLLHRAAQFQTAAETAALHARASAWLAANGQLFAAVTHAVQAGNVQALAALVRDNRHSFMSSGSWARVETLRHLIPRALILQHPQLLILDAWSLSHRAMTTECGQCLDAIIALLAVQPLPEDESRLLQGELDAMRSQALFWTGDVETVVELARRSLVATPYTYVYTRSLAWLYRITCLQMTGEEEAATSELALALRESALHGEDTYPELVLVTACFFHWLRADMVRMEEEANHVLEEAQERGHLEGVAWARYFRGCACYQRNDLADAEQDFAAVQEMGYIAPAFAHSQSAIGLAATYQAMGEFEKAHATAVESWQRYHESDNPVLAARAEAYLAYLNFRQDRMDEALRWVAQPSRISPISPMPLFHAALVGRAAILLGTGSPEAQVEAAELLPILRASVERRHNIRFMIEVLAIQALLLASGGDMEGALKLLERAVQFTIPGQAIRALADYDFQIGPLLDELAKHSTARTQIHRIRRAALVFRPAPQPENQASEAAERGPAPASKTAYIRHPDLLESLTHREMDVLMLLLERPSNKEIAAQLNISTETVKRHMVNLFRKLHVDNRRQAIIQARIMGLLPPS